MRKYSILSVGILCLIVSFIWMIFSQSSTGPFLILSSISGAIIMEGIHRVRNKS